MLDLVLFDVGVEEPENKWPAPKQFVRDKKERMTWVKRIRHLKGKVWIITANHGWWVKHFADPSKVAVIVPYNGPQVKPRSPFPTPKENHQLRDALRRGRPGGYLVGRTATGEEQLVGAYLNGGQWTDQTREMAANNVGISPADDFNLATFSRLYRHATITANALATWQQVWFPHEDVILDRDAPSEDRFEFSAHTFNVFNFHYQLDSWAQGLRGQRVLIIAGAAKAMEQQADRLDLCFPGRVPRAHEYLFMETPLSQSKDWRKSPTGKSWVTNLVELQAKLLAAAPHFDVALLSCGGYGLPLCAYIKHVLGKKAIYIGGALQLFFGVRGKRWDNEPEQMAFLNEHWIGNEVKPANWREIEGGAYW